MEMKRKLFFTIMLVLILPLVVASPFYYEIEVKYNFNDEINPIEILSVNVVYSQSDLVIDEGEAKLVLEDGDGEVIDDVKFFVPDQIHSETINEVSGELEKGEVVYQDEGVFLLYAPYDERATSFIIYDIEGSEFLSKDIGEFAKVDLGEGDEEENVMEDIGGDKSDNFWAYFLFFVIILIVFVVIFLFLRRKS